MGLWAGTVLLLSNCPLESASPGGMQQLTVLPFEACETIDVTSGKRLEDTLVLQVSRGFFKNSATLMHGIETHADAYRTHK